VLARWQFWVTTIVALLAALMAAYTAMLFVQNQSTQAEFTRRTQTLQRGLQLEPFYRDIVKALADLSIRNQDKALSDLLATQGITVNQPAPANPAPPSPADTKKGTKP
jgi:hypothetical protein